MFLEFIFVLGIEFFFVLGLEELFIIEFLFMEDFVCF